MNITCNSAAHCGTRTYHATWYVNVPGGFKRSRAQGRDGYCDGCDHPASRGAGRGAGRGGRHDGCAGYVPPAPARRARGVDRGRRLPRHHRRRHRPPRPHVTADVLRALRRQGSVFRRAAHRRQRRHGPARLRRRRREGPRGYPDPPGDHGVDRRRGIPAGPDAELDPRLARPRRRGAPPPAGPAGGVRRPAPAAHRHRGTAGRRRPAGVPGAGDRPARRAPRADRHHRRGRRPPQRHHRGGRPGGDGPPAPRPGKARNPLIPNDPP
jgi:hypothetical protein